MHSNHTITASENSWSDRLLPFLGPKHGVLLCFDPNIKPLEKVGIGSYGYNGFGSNPLGDSSLNLGLGLGGTHPVVRSSDVIAPSEMVAIGDLQLPPAVWLSTINPTLQRLGGMTGLVPARHQGGANMLFCDNHVEFGKQWKWIQTHRCRQAALE